MSDDRYRDPYAGPPGADYYEPSPSIVTTAHIVYGLHTLAVVVGIAGTATVVGSFLLGIPSIVAVIVNYVRRPEARGTFVESHFRWQIRTFWFTLLWVSVCFLLAVTIVGILAAWVGMGLTSVWLIYRVARGWLRLRDGLPMYADE
jgi:uncharacterized membrane protein